MKRFFAVILGLILLLAAWHLHTQIERHRAADSLFNWLEIFGCLAWGFVLITGSHMGPQIDRFVQSLKALAAAAYARAQDALKPSPTPSSNQLPTSSAIADSKESEIAILQRMAAKHPDKIAVFKEMAAELIDVPAQGGA